MTLTEIRARLAEIEAMLGRNARPRSLVLGEIDNQLANWKKAADRAALVDLERIRAKQTVRLLSASDLPVGALLVAIVGVEPVRKWLGSLAASLPEPEPLDLVAITREVRELSELEAQILMSEPV